MNFGNLRALALATALAAAVIGCTPVPLSGGPSMYGTGPSKDPPQTVRTAPEVYLIYFGIDSSAISPIGQGIIQRIAVDAKANPPTRVTVNGYADKLGPADHNQVLSEERAEAVVQALVKAGVVGINMRKLGMGEEQTVDAPFGGRHVEIRLYRE